MSEQALKFEYEQTPEPWYLGWDGKTIRRWDMNVLGGQNIASFWPRCNNDEQGDSEDEDKYADLIARINAKRCVDAVNALAGIPNPAEFVRAARELAEKMQEIAEYWNGRENQTAMLDALSHNQRVADAALSAFLAAVEGEKGAKQ